MKQATEPEIWPETGRLPGSPAVHLTDVWASCNGTPVLKGVDLAVGRGSCWVVMGPSGAGKSTLLKTMNGLLPVSRGTVSILGRPLERGAGLRRLRARIGYIPQNLGLVKNRTVLENVLLGALPRTPLLPSLVPRFAPEAEAAAREALEQVGIGERADRPAHALSGGERQRVAIARALVQRPDILLADEFVSELDYVRAREVMDLVEQIRRKLGMTLVTIQHEIEIARTYGDRIAVVREGRKIAEVAPGDLTQDLLQVLFCGREVPPRGPTATGVP
ncbi:MAG: ATP-binding cassette domain-containing protein [Halobacteria archaeon]